MGMNLYLIYLATLISSSSFNTINYIYNKRRQLKSKKRHLVFKKNLSHKTKVYSSVGDTIPSIMYLGSTVFSLIPIVNIFVPEISNRLYDGLCIDDAIDTYYESLNNAEITKRYGNGLSLKIMEECGYTVPEELKKQEIDTSKIDVKEEIKDTINDQVKLFYDAMYPEKEKVGSIDDIIMLSDKELKKRQNKAIRLTLESDIDFDKINRVSNI